MGIETLQFQAIGSARKRLNGLGSPMGIETLNYFPYAAVDPLWLNGLGSPMGIETV